MKQQYFPTLSSDGWVTDSNITANYLFSHFLESDHSQTQLYLGSVSSLAKIIQETQSDPLETSLLLRRRLDEYFSRYFDGVVIETTHKQLPNKPTEFSVDAFISYKDKNGVEQILAKSFDVIEGKARNVINISNYGTQGV